MAQTLRHLVKGDEITSPRRQSGRATYERSDTVFEGGMHTFFGPLGSIGGLAIRGWTTGGQGLPGGSRSVKVVGVCGIESGHCNQRWGVGIYCRTT
jgi:hypothetical protein